MSPIRPLETCGRFFLRFKPVPTFPPEHLLGKHRGNSTTLVAIRMHIRGYASWGRNLSAQNGKTPTRATTLHRCLARLPSQILIGVTVTVITLTGEICGCGQNRIGRCPPRVLSAVCEEIQRQAYHLRGRAITWTWSWGRPCCRVVLCFQVILFRDYLADLRTAVQDTRVDMTAGDNVVNTLLHRLKEKYGTWGFFDDFAKENIFQTAQELSGKKRLPQPIEAGGAQ